MTALTSMELWRTHNGLSIVDAAILIVGGDPADFDKEQKDWIIAGILSFNWDGGEISGAALDTAFKGLRQAVVSNKLQADIVHCIRTSQESSFEGGYGVGQSSHEHKETFKMLVKRSGAKTEFNFDLDQALLERDLYIWKDPDWHSTTVNVDDLKDWMIGQDFFPKFFFPEGRQEGFRNKDHPRYTPKLACAVAAWENVKSPSPNQSVKQTLSDWIQSNGAQFGMGEGSDVSPTAAEEVAKIANWQTKGGATATSMGTDS